MLSAVTGMPNAANMLHTMSTSQESFFGGYYSGICTLSDHSYSLIKNIGPVCSLGGIKAVDELKGSSGLAHSRTAGGGGATRAQPFLAHGLGVAGMGTGVHGVFAKTHKENRQALAIELFNSGVQFTSTESSLPGSAVLPNGSSIHNTELVVQGIGHLLQQGTSPFDAIREIVTRIPSEGAYVFLFRDFPEKLFVANYNLRLLVSVNNGGCAIASSIFGLPENISISQQEIPMNCLATCSYQGLQSEELNSSLGKDLDCKVPIGLETAFLRFVEFNPEQTWATIVERALLPLFPTDRATLLMPLAFQVAEKLIKEQRVKVKDIPVTNTGNSNTPMKAVFELCN